MNFQLRRQGWADFLQPVIEDFRRLKRVAVLAALQLQLHGGLAVVTQQHLVAPRLLANVGDVAEAQVAVTLRLQGDAAESLGIAALLDGAQLAGRILFAGLACRQIP